MKINKLTIRRFIARYFSIVVQLFYYIKFKLIHFSKKSPIIILTPGKVGSTSIYNILKNEFKNPIFHIHQISRKGIHESWEKHINSDRKSVPLHLIISKLLHKKLTRYSGPIYIITIVREPIAREISAFFQNTEFFKTIVEDAKLNVDVQKSVYLLREIFERNIILDIEDWFNSEIKNYFGIDIFSIPFNEEKGFTIFKNGRFKLLLLKTETMNHVFQIALSEFLQKDIRFAIQKSNVGDNKHYAESYSQVKNQFKLDESVINQIISSRYFQHFYKGMEYKVVEKWRKE
jgi:hypothetical protein